MYYMNCGVYNSFLDELLGVQARLPELLCKVTKFLVTYLSLSFFSIFIDLLLQPRSDEKFPSSIWGPTADSFDLIVKNMLLPELYIGDWLIWKNMGAYTLALSNTFNGFPIPVVKPFIRKSQWLVCKMYL